MRGALASCKLHLFWAQAELQDAALERQQMDSSKVLLPGKDGGDKREADVKHLTRTQVGHRSDRQRAIKYIVEHVFIMGALTPGCD